MAITVNTQILNQQATFATTYCYLYEPLRVFIEESDLEGTKFYIDLELISTTNNTTVVQTLEKYAEFDISPGEGLTVDLMKIVQQHFDTDIYNFSHIDELTSVQGGWDSVVSKYKYRFLIYSDVTETPVQITKLPVIYIFTIFHHFLCLLCNRRYSDSLVHVQLHFHQVYCTSQNDW